MSRQQGFTLYEVLIVVTIIGILVAIAYPAYTGQVRKGRRAEAQSLVQDLALSQEQWRANDTDYATTAELDGPIVIDHYTITIDTVSATTFRVVATATSGDQLQDEQGGVSCTPLTLNQSGVRGPAACW